MRAVRILAVVCLVAMCAAGALAQGTYTQIDYPGATYTYCSGINSAGEIVGTYFDPEVNAHGFLLSNGLYTTIDFPGQSDSGLTSLNDVGQVVGLYDAPNILAAFLYDRQAQLFTSIYDPNSINTSVFGINNAGLIVGTLIDENGSTGFKTNITGHFSKIKIAGFPTTSLRFINNLGESVVAGTSNIGVLRYLVLKTGNTRILNFSSQRYSIFGMNDNGAFVGSDRNESVGFIYQAGTLQSLIVPGAVYTIASGINNAGSVIGYFNDGTTDHCFLWTPPAPQKGH